MNQRERNLRRSCLRSGERASDQQSHAGWFGDGRRVGWVVCCDDELVLGAVDIVREVELSKDERGAALVPVKS